MLSPCTRRFSPFSGRLSAFLLLVLISVCWSSGGAWAVTVEQIVPRENPSFNPRQSTLTTGKDGLVYLTSPGPNDTAWTLRMAPDGTARTGGQVVYAIADITANTDGVMASANGHFAHKVTLYDRNFQNLAEQPDFLVSDTVGWDAPRWVEAGASGDFYGIDQHRDRILRISPEGKIRQAYTVPHVPDGGGGLVEEFRVNEARQLFYLVKRSGPVRVVGFDGQEKFTLAAGIGWNAAAFDVAADGTIYTLGSRDQVVHRWNPQGQPAGDIVLKMGDLKPDPTQSGFTALRLAGNSLVTHWPDAVQLYQRYSMTGDLLNAEEANHERLAMTYPSEVWTAGQAVPFKLTFDPGKAAIKPQWRVWAQPLGVPLWQEWPLQNGNLQVPESAGGLYQIKVTPEVEPQFSKLSSEYAVRSWVEVRQDGATGTLNVLTPGNRVFFGRGEDIPYTVLLRSGSTAPVRATIRLLPYPTTGAKPIVEGAVTLNSGQVQNYALAGALSGALAQGTYVLEARAPGLTIAPHYLVLGSGMRRPAFNLIDYGDYGATYPSASIWESTDAAWTHAQRTARLGFTMLTDRLGVPMMSNDLWPGPFQNQLSPVTDRLQKDPNGLAPESVGNGSTLMQTLQGYSAMGISEMPILLMMDAGLPLGAPGFDNRKPDQLVQDITKVTQALLPLPSFRGWCWNANWWIYNQKGCDAARTPEEKTACLAALDNAKKTGAWADVLDTVANIRLNFAVQAQDLFNKTLKPLTPDKITATAGTYRNVDSYPPISFSNVDEVDLQGQFEQIFLPYFPPHAVDYEGRPGKPVWGHPEIWNDPGTGDQVGPVLMQMLMRGANGLGPSGNIPPWVRAEGMPDDPRLAHHGYLAVFRAVNNLIKPYGAWYAGLQKADQVAIVISGRQMKIDEWTPAMGRQFARYMEAWVTCLHSGHPASYVFAEDLKPGTLKQYKAVLVVSQWVQPEPPLQAALEEARAAGIPVLADGTCRADFVKNYRTLPVSFDKFEKDPHPASDDSAYLRFHNYVLADLPAVQAALDPISPPVIRSDNPEILSSLRTSGAGAFICLVNNTTPELDPGQIWRVTLTESTRVPVVANVTLPGLGTGSVVYDAFSRQKLVPVQGAVKVDLRSVPGRILAILPAAIGQVRLRATAPGAMGDVCAWDASVLDPGGRPLNTTLPLRLRLMGPGNQVLEERYLTCPVTGVSGRTRTVLNGGTPQILEITELISGQTARASLTPPPFRLPLPLNIAPAAAAPGAAVQGVNSRLQEVPEDGFGPHLRDVALLADGQTLAVSAMNWDTNLYLVDTQAAKIKSRQRVGSYFAFAPQAAGNGLAVQGFDFNSASGYHLYLLDDQGAAQRRFALYGLPKRLPHRFVPGLLGDRINQFASASDGSWVASAGDLGLAVWDAAGNLKWKDDWWRTERHTAYLARFDDQTVLVGEGMKVTLRSVGNGDVKWERTLASTGDIQHAYLSGDGKTMVITSTTNGGRLFVLRGNAVVRELPTPATAVGLDQSGDRLLVVTANQLKLYTVQDGLQWTYQGEEVVRYPTFSPDGKRLVITSDLGTVTVLDAAGHRQWSTDTGGFSVPQWLPDGDLVLCNWMGQVQRVDANYKSKWSLHLQPEPTDMRGKMAVKVTVPEVQVPGWGNALTTPLPLTPNLVDPKTIRITFVGSQNYLQFERDAGPMVDGDLTPPVEPWLSWSNVSSFAETSPVNYVMLDTFRTQLRLDAITFVEDPRHPESWLRDLRLDRWDAAGERWVPVQQLLSDAAIHSHRLEQPVEGFRFRLMLPRGVVGNIRLAEIILHGQNLGGSHPDVLAKKPVATLVDEGEDLKDYFVGDYNGLRYKLNDAFSGSRRLELDADKDAWPNFRPPFGHVMSGWDFEIAEKPQPGQYRYAQFAWKALSPATRGITLRIGGVAAYAGELSARDGYVNHQVAAVPPQQWQTVRLDLWDLLKRPTRVQVVTLATKGGPAAFDAILLGRTAQDLDQWQPIKP